MSAVGQIINVVGAATASKSFVSLFLSFMIATYSLVGYLFQSPDRVSDTGYFSLLPEYDFIIVGGGSAGAVVANRLSEISSWKILLLEAGVDETALSDVPVMAPYLQMSNMDWQYKTEPQPTSCLAMKEGRCNWPRGKVLGGSSVLNYMLYYRGNKKDFDGWAVLGNTGWSYDEVLPYFIKSEDNNNPNYTATPYHGTGGYLSVSDPPYKTPLADAYVQAGAELGYPTVDNNGASQVGFGIIQGTVRNGQRCSTAKAFLRPARNRPNLHIAMNAYVYKININPITKRAESVFFFKDYLPKTIKARKEIILSAGALSSPHLLMLSGVGPKADLQSVGIPVITDLSVGRNLQDHIAMCGLTFTINQTVSLLQDDIINMDTYMKYATQNTGPLTIKGSSEAAAYLNTKYADPAGDFPDVMLQFSPVSFASDGGGQTQAMSGLTDAFYNQVFGPILNKHSWSVMPMILRPKSQGYMKIISSSAFVRPLFYSNYLTHPDDIKVIREAVKIVLALGNTTAMQKFGSRLHDVPYPGCTHLPFMSDDYIECATRQCTFNIYHQSGTCKMGPASDPTAVVDPTLRVHGIQGLRVIDASIMPNVVSANTNAATIMIGEKGSDLIKSTYKP